MPCMIYRTRFAITYSSAPGFRNTVVPTPYTATSPSHLRVISRQETKEFHYSAGNSGETINLPAESPGSYQSYDVAARVE